MNAETKQKSRQTLENILLIAVFWGGAFALGFLLGFG